MHLSFFLDQCTDEVDCLTPRVKSQTDKRFALSTAKKNKIAKQLLAEGVKYAPQILQLIDLLSKPAQFVPGEYFQKKRQSQAATGAHETHQGEESRRHGATLEDGRLFRTRSGYSAEEPAGRHD